MKPDKLSSPKHVNSNYRVRFVGKVLGRRTKQHSKRSEKKMKCFYLIDNAET